MQISKNMKKLKKYDKVLVRNYDTEQWRISIFIKENTFCDEFKYECNDFTYIQCIPFEGFEFLLNTNNKKRIKKLNKYDRVLVRNYDNELWRISIFIKDNTLWGDEFKYECNDFHYIQCIPYKGFEFLLNTKNAPNDGKKY